MHLRTLATSSDKVRLGSGVSRKAESRRVGGG
ncbi:hypothetical protein BH11MYX4_BH11MYX4_05870 [soil metagenome]